MNIRHAAAAVLGVCAASDLAAVPLLLGSDDVPAGVGIGVAVLGVLTALAAAGVARDAAWARPLGLITRVLDVVGVVPVLAGGVGAAETSAGAVTVVLSLVAIGFLVRGQRRPARTV